MSFMLTALALALAAPAPRTVSAPVVTASLFKNGYAFVTREVRIPGAGEVTLDMIPQSSYGTLWFQATGGAKLDNVRAVRDFVTSPGVSYPAPTFETLLAANVGRKVRLHYRATEPNAPYVDGTVKSITGTMIVLDTATGPTAFLTFGLTRVTPLDGKPFRESSNAAGYERRAIRIKTTGTAGRVLIVSLERGLSWTPGYAVDLTSETELTLVAKATVANDLDDLRAVETRLITGYPNLPYAQALDPFVQGLNMGGGGLADGAVGGFGGGGMGGGQPMFTSNAAMPAPAMKADFDQMESNNPARNAGEGREDLFFYRLPALSLKRNERQWQVIFSMKSAYKHVYTWDVAEQPTGDGGGYLEPAAGPQDVWHAVAFRNTSGQPLTTGSAITTQKGEILGQDDLGYVSIGGDTELRITKALDVRAEIAEIETNRERGFEKFADGNPRIDRLTVTGTLSLANRKSIPVTMRIKKGFVGEPLRADGSPATDGTLENEPKIVRNARGLRALNPAGSLVWTIVLKPGEERKIGYSVRFLTPSR